MVRISDDELRNLLTASGKLSKADIERAFKRAASSQASPIDVLVGEELIKEDALTKILAEYFDVPYLELNPAHVSIGTMGLLPEELARKYQAFPIEKTDKLARVAITDPSDLSAIKALENHFKVPVEISMVTKSALNDAIALYKRDFSQNFADIIKENIQKAKIQGKGAEDAAKDVPVIKILTAIFEYASTLKASDVHFEPEEERLLVRFRVDGVLRDVVDIPLFMHPAIVSRIKILSNLKIDEHRLPQEGRFLFESSGQRLSLRVSIIPTHYGERAEMRILAEETRPFTFSELGFSKANQQIMEEESKRPYGMILVTGPTGSGKTTSLYTLLQFLNDPKVNIVTVEDPVEYSIPHISQMQINDDIGLTFAEGLKSMLRQDPNIIMIGEIRDPETAKTAVNAALTGHIVLSTLHTNDAASAIPRLIDLGVEPFLLASTIRAIVAQRLVRKVCAKCVKSVKLERTPSMVALIRELAVVHQVRLSLIPHEIYQPVPCVECPDGYKGRSGIYEVMRVSPKISDMILQRAAAFEIKEQARKEGMTTMLEDGLKKMQMGQTTLEEIIRVIKE